MLEDEDLVDCANDCVFELSPDAWIAESYALADKFAYTDVIREAVLEADAAKRERVKRIQLEASYYRNGADVLRERAVISGYRLSVLLETLLSDHDHDDADG